MPDKPTNIAADWGRKHAAPCLYCGHRTGTPVYASRAVCDDTAACRERVSGQRNRMHSALEAIDAEAEVARTEATGDIYEISEATFAQVKEALAHVR